MEHAIVRIRNVAGDAVGAGFLFAPGLVITCAHVIEAALDLPRGSSPSAEMRVTVDFPLVDGAPTAEAEIGFWLAPRYEPPSLVTSPASLLADDIAGLVLITGGGPPCSPPDIRKLGDVWSDTFRAFGFPAPLGIGAWVTGVILGKVENGWYQLDASSSGFAIEAGFSGAPVWDEVSKSVAGMIVAEYHRRGAAYMIPISAIADIWDAFASVVKPSNATVISATQVPTGSALVGKLRAGGADDDFIQDAVDLRATAAKHDSDALETHVNYDEALAETVRRKLIFEVNVLRDKFSDSRAPAHKIRVALWTLLQDHPERIDEHRLWLQNPYLLLGEVYEITDECRIRWVSGA